MEQDGKSAEYSAISTFFQLFRAIGQDYKNFHRSQNKDECDEDACKAEFLVVKREREIFAGTFYPGLYLNTRKKVNRTRGRAELDGYI